MSRITLASSLVIMGALASSPCGGADTVFPVRVRAQVGQARAASSVQVLVEEDKSTRWQQFLEAAAVNGTGQFEVRLSGPGDYWLLATEETDWSYRRGACLVTVEATGAYTLRPVPATKTGRKWGGPRATASCLKGVVPLAVYRSKPAHRKRK